MRAICGPDHAEMYEAIYVPGRAKNYRAEAADLTALER